MFPKVHSILNLRRGRIPKQNRKQKVVGKFHHYKFHWTQIFYSDFTKYLNTVFKIVLSIK